MRAGVAAHTGWLTLSGPQASARKRGDGKYVIRLYRVLLLTESCVLYSALAEVMVIKWMSEQPLARRRP